MLDLRREPEPAGHLADLVLVEVGERLDDARKFHIEGHAADVVVALYPPLALDAVGADRPLQEHRRPRPFRLPLKYPDELLTDDLALLFGIGGTPEGLEELVARIHDVEVHVREEGLYLPGLAFSHETGIDVYRYESVTDGPGGKRSADRRVHAARERHNDPFAPGNIPYPLDRFTDELLDVHHSGVSPVPEYILLFLHASTKPM